MWLARFLSVLLGLVGLLGLYAPRQPSFAAFPPGSAVLLQSDKAPEDSPRLPKGVPAKVGKVLRHIDENGSAPDGYVGGRTFLNLGRDGEQALPKTDARGRNVKYREWDVNPKVPGKNRGPERLVTGSDGSAYYTADHYRTFTKVR